MRSVVVCLLAAASLPAQNSAMSCEVSLRVVDYTGKPIPHRVVAFVDSTGKNFASSFTSLRGEVPCRKEPYDVLVTRSDLNSHYANILRPMTVADPQNWLTLVTDPHTIFIDGRAGSISRAPPVGYVWKGQVEPRWSEKLWIQIRSAVSPSALTEVETDGDGAFQIYDPFNRGPYLLSVMNRQGQVMYTVPLNIQAYAPREPLRIVLSQAPPAEIVVR